MSDKGSQHSMSGWHGDARYDENFEVRESIINEIGNLGIYSLDLLPYVGKFRRMVGFEMSEESRDEFVRLIRKYAELKTPRYSHLEFTPAIKGLVEISVESE